MAILHNRFTNKPGRAIGHRSRLTLCGVYSMLAVVNVGLMAGQPTAWQGIFAAALLGGACWMWFAAA